MKVKSSNIENTKKFSEEFDKTDINFIISKIDKIKQKTYKKNHKETPFQYLLRKLKNLIKKRNEYLTDSINWNDDLLDYYENEIIEYYKKYLIEKSRSRQGKSKSGDRFGTESNNSFLSIDTKRNKH